MSKKGKEPIVSASDFDRVMEVLSGVLDDTIGKKHKNGPYIKALLHLFNLHVHPYRFKKLPKELQKTLLTIKQAVNASHAVTAQANLAKAIKDNKKKGLVCQKKL